MDPSQVERLLAERDCERLIVEYAHRLDLGQVERVADLFADDAVWEMPGMIRFQGRADLAAGIPARLSSPGRTTRHLCTNVAIDVTTSDDATGLCYFTNYRNDSVTGLVEQPAPISEPHYVGQYEDRFVRTPSGWLFAHRRVILAFAHQQSLETSAAKPR
jgi:hypothetical protein